MKVYRTLLAILATCSLMACQSGGSGSKAEPASTANQRSVIAKKDSLNPALFSMMLSHAHVQLVDVRTPEEYASGHLAGAVNMDWNGSSFNEQMATLKKEQPVFVYCKMGGRSGEASDALAAQGFLEVHNLEGGIAAWKSQGLPVEK